MLLNSAESLPTLSPVAPAAWCMLAGAACGSTSDFTWPSMQDMGEGVYRAVYIANFAGTYEVSMISKGEELRQQKTIRCHAA